MSRRGRNSALRGGDCAGRTGGPTRGFRPHDSAADRELVRAASPSLVAPGRQLVGFVRRNGRGASSKLRMRRLRTLQYRYSASRVSGPADGHNVCADPLNVKLARPGHPQPSHGVGPLSGHATASDLSRGAEIELTARPPTRRLPELHAQLAAGRPDPAER
jgi:hypothetical protein